VYLEDFYKIIAESLLEAEISKKIDIGINKKEQVLAILNNALVSDT
jgi:hypothetical protein